jgi:hypothetical protein
MEARVFRRRFSTSSALIPASHTGHQIPFVAGDVHNLRITRDGNIQTIGGESLVSNVVQCELKLPDFVTVTRICVHGFNPGTSNDSPVVCVNRALPESPVNASVEGEASCVLLKPGFPTWCSDTFAHGIVNSSYAYFITATAQEEHELWTFEVQY